MRRRLGFAVLLASLVLSWASGAAPADGGLTPDEPVSTGSGAGPNLAIAPNGFAAAAWIETLTGGQTAIGVATRPPGGVWSRPELVGASSTSKGAVSVAVDPSGDVALTWHETVSSTGFTRVASHAVGGAFTAAELLNDASSFGASAVGINASGRVTLLYNPFPGVAARDFQAGSSALAATPQTISSGSPRSCFGAQLAVAPTGDAVAGYDCDGATFALRQAGAWRASPTVASTTPACPSVSTSQSVDDVAIDGQGHAVGVMTTRVVDTTGVFDPMFCFILPARRTETVRLVLPIGGVMTPLAGAVVTASATSSSSLLFGPQVGIAPARIVAAWLALDDRAGAYRVRVRDLDPSGTPTGAEQTIAPSTSVGALQLAFGDDGHALLSWAPQVSFGAPRAIEAASRPAGGGLGAPQEVTPFASSMIGFASALDASGDGAVAYVADGAPSLVHVRGFDAGAPQLSGVSIPASATVGAPAAFAASAFDVWSALTTSWSFGDGTSASGATAQHAYARAGAFTATVTAVDALGNVASRAGVVQVPAPGGGAGGGESAGAPSLAGASLTHRMFRVGRAPTAVSAAARRRRGRAAPAGTTFTFTLDRTATVTIAFARQASGKRSGRRCVRPSRRLARARRCTRLVAAGKLTRAGRAGANAVPFSGRLGRRALAPGRYRATLTATAGGTAGAPRTLGFRVVR